MNIAFFTEAGIKRGMGHLVRSYTIAQKFKDNSCAVDFFLDSDIDFAYKFDELKQFSWDTFKIEKKYDVIFIDSYEATLAHYQEAVNNSKIAVFLDDENRLSYPKGVIINFAPDANKVFFPTKQKENTYLLGLDYIPIRKEFIEAYKEKKESIFIMLGGADTNCLSYDIIELLQDIDVKKIIVTNDTKMKEKLEKFAKVKVLYRPNDDELIKIMTQSSIAISTASMTIYELAYLQIPTISISVNTNQHNGASQLIKYNITKANISIEESNWKNKLYKELQHLIQNKNAFQTNNKIDGLGTQRIFDSISRLIQ